MIYTSEHTAAVLATPAPLWLGLWGVALWGAGLNRGGSGRVPSPCTSLGLLGNSQGDWTGSRNLVTAITATQMSLAYYTAWLVGQEHPWNTPLPRQSQQHAGDEREGDILLTTGLWGQHIAPTYRTDESIIFSSWVRFRPHLSYLIFAHSTVAFVTLLQSTAYFSASTRFLHWGLIVFLPSTTSVHRHWCWVWFSSDSWWMWQTSPQASPSGACLTFLSPVVCPSLTTLASSNW